MYVCVYDTWKLSHTGHIICHKERQVRLHLHGAPEAVGFLQHIHTSYYEMKRGIGYMLIIGKIGQRKCCCLVLDTDISSILLNYIIVIFLQI